MNSHQTWSSLKSVIVGGSWTVGHNSDEVDHPIRVHVGIFKDVMHKRRQGSTHRLKAGNWLFHTVPLQDFSPWLALRRSGAPAVAPVVSDRHKGRTSQLFLLPSQHAAGLREAKLASLHRARRNLGVFDVLGNATWLQCGVPEHTT